MPLGEVVARGLSGLTPQQVADLALEEDRAARRAAGRGDSLAAWSHRLECEALCKAMPAP